LVTTPALGRLRSVQFWANLDERKIALVADQTIFGFVANAPKSELVGNQSNFGLINDGNKVVPVARSHLSGST
jgi:hypothetical protein